MVLSTAGLSCIFDDQEESFTLRDREWNAYSDTEMWVLDHLSTFTRNMKDENNRASIADLEVSLCFKIEDECFFFTVVNGAIGNYSHSYVQHATFVIVTSAEGFEYMKKGDIFSREFYNHSTVYGSMDIVLQIWEFLF